MKPTQSILESDLNLASPSFDTSKNLLDILTFVVLWHSVMLFLNYWIVYIKIRSEILFNKEINKPKFWVKLQLST